MKLRSLTSSLLLRCCHLWFQAHCTYPSYTFANCWALPKRVRTHVGLPLYGAPSESLSSSLWSWLQTRRSFHSPQQHFFQVLRQLFFEHSPPPPPSKKVYVGLTSHFFEHPMNRSPSLWSWRPSDKLLFLLLPCTQNQSKLANPPERSDYHNTQLNAHVIILRILLRP